MDEIAIRIVTLAAEQDFGFRIVLRAVDIALDLVERLLVDDGAHEVAEVRGIADTHICQYAEDALANLGPQRFRYISARCGAALLTLIFVGAADDARRERVHIGARMRQNEILAA